MPSGEWQFVTNGEIAAQRLHIILLAAIPDA
jgi:hypothetical protein